jgi:hypothetical protein
MPATYEPIATQTLTSSTTSIGFASIPGTYTDLVLVVNQYLVTGSQNTKCWVNGDTATNYSVTYLYGGSGAAASGRFTNQSFVYAGETGSTIATTILQFNNYSNTTTYKTILLRDSSPGNSVSSWMGLWRSTAAITTINFGAASGGSFGSGSTFTLYGIAAA